MKLAADKSDGPAQSLSSSGADHALRLALGFLFLLVGVGLVLGSSGSVIGYLVIVLGLVRVLSSYSRS